MARCTFNLLNAFFTPFSKSYAKMVVKAAIKTWNFAEAECLYVFLYRVKLDQKQLCMPEIWDVVNHFHVPRKFLLLLTNDTVDTRHTYLVSGITLQASTVTLSRSRARWFRFCNSAKNYDQYWQSHTRWLQGPQDSPALQLVDSNQICLWLLSAMTVVTPRCSQWWNL